MTVYHPNGVIASQMVYVNGKLQGEQVRYDQHGIIQSKVTFNQGVREGPAIQYVRGHQMKLFDYRNNNMAGMSIMGRPGWMKMH